jgi:hypothetical protein
MKKILVVVGMIAAAGILYACGGSSSKGGSGITTTVAAPAISATKTPVSTPAEAAKAVNASKTLASSFASGSSFPSLGSLVGKPAADQTANGHKIISTVRDLQRRITEIVDKQKSLGKQVAAAQSQACTDGGTLSLDPASNPLVITFTACKEGNEYQNGTVSMPQAMLGQTSSSTGGTLSVNLTSISYTPGSGYTIKQNESALNMTMTLTSFDTTTGSMNLAMNGSQSQIDYINGTSEKQSFGNFSLSMTENTSGVVTNTSMTLSGAVSMDAFTGTTFSTIDTASGMAFQNLVLTDVYNSTTFVDTLTINGTYAIKTIPACMDGTFVISTQTALTTTSGVTTGQMTVNDVVMVFNADGTVTATINGTPQIITSYANVCSLSF